MTATDVILERPSLPLLTMNELIQGINGTLKFFWKSYASTIPLDLKLTRNELLRYSLATGRGFVVGKGRRRNLLNVWFQWCAATRHPFIYVWLYPKHANVEMDLLQYGYDLSENAYEEIRAKFDSSREQMRAVAKPTVCVGKIMSMYLGIKREFALELGYMFLRLALESKENENV